MNHTSSYRSILLLALSGLGTQALAADPALDESTMSFDEKLTACAACHGENGAKPILPEYPILAGQYADYLAQALHAYRSGRRQNPIMNMQMEALELSDADIERLSAHFAAQHGVSRLPE